LTDYTLSTKNYRESISKKNDFFLQFPIFTPNVEAIILKIIHRYLEEFDLIYIKETVVMIIKELINNSIKANMKRLYFKINNLDIDKIEDYRSGMESFKADTYETEKVEYFEKLKQSKLVVRVSFKSTNNFFHLNVVNNIPILDSELVKINARAQKAFAYNDMSHALDDILDDSEGAGLGLIMSLMLLKNIGLTKESFQIYKKDNLTIATISIPKNLSHHKSTIKVAEEILKEVNELPTFPANVKEIQKIVQDKDSSFKIIAGKIYKDPGITASILKLANSAGYIRSNKADSIEDAIKIIGMKGINTLLYASGVNSMLESRYKRFEHIWKISYQRAFYAQNIAIQVKLSKIGEFAYLSGLLADIGKIVMLSTKPEILEKLKELTGTKNSTGNLLEEISLGISHSSLGAEICRKWKFNDNLCKTIKFYNRPHMANNKLKQLIYIVYLANVFINIENRKIRFEIVDEDVLDYFNLNDKEKFTNLHSLLIKSYEKNKINFL